MEPIQYIQRIRSNKAGEKPVELAEIVAGIVVLLFGNHVFLFFFRCFMKSSMIFQIFICLKSSPAFLQGTPDQVAGDFEVGEGVNHMKTGR